MKRISSPQNQGWDEEVIGMLKRLGAFQAEYPGELLAARRAAFLRQLQQVSGSVENPVPADARLLHYLETLKSISMEYPQALRASRREAFVDQVKRYNSGAVELVEESDVEDQEIIGLLGRLKSLEAEYPANLLAARRAAFRRQLQFGAGLSLLEALRTWVRNLVPRGLKPFPMQTTNMLRTSFVVMMLLLAVFAGSLMGIPVQFLNPAQGEVAQPGFISVATSTSEVAAVTCKPGYLPPLCLVKEFDKSEDLTFQGNGLARPAVAKDTLSGMSGVHKAAYVNDGMYGPGTTWISDSAYSWIKIDLGTATTINTVAFGRDRLGTFNDHDPGQFVIAVALSDNIYADGNSNNDYVEYTQVFDSAQAGFNGVISGPETIQAHFSAVTARFIKITFANKGTAVDEVEAFMLPPSVIANAATRAPRNGAPGVPPVFIPTSTPVPTNTATRVPTNTPFPTDTDTPVPPTNTPVPTNTATPVPTDTPVPPTNTPVPTDTPVPTNTPVPPPTDTPVPTDTAVSFAGPLQPTDTFVPPTGLSQVMADATSTPMPSPVETP